MNKREISFTRILATARRPHAAVGNSYSYRGVVTKQHTVAYLFVLFFSCLSLSVFAQTDEDYTAEIMQHIVDPCFKYSAGKSEPIPEVSELEMVTLMKLMSPDAVQDTIDVTLPVVKGKPIDARMEIYKFGLDTCIRGTRK